MGGVHSVPPKAMTLDAQGYLARRRSRTAADLLLRDAGGSVRQLQCGSA